MKKSDISKPDMGQAAPAADSAESENVCAMNPKPSQWFKFPSDHTIEFTVRESGGRNTWNDVTKQGVAISLCTTSMILNAVSYIHSGTKVIIPLDTVDGEPVNQTGVVVSCVMISFRNHRTEIQFDIELVPEHYVVCWGDQGRR